MLKGIKQLKRQKNPAKQEECTKSNDLFNAIKPVWFEKHGKVSSEWLSICKEERNQTTNLLDNISSLGNLEKAFKKVKENQCKCLKNVDRLTVYITCYFLQTICKST